MDTIEIAGRTVAGHAAADFRPYVRYGAPIPGLSWSPIRDDPATGDAAYYLRFAPGARSRPHEHVGREEFYVIEGELTDPDGRVFRAGEFVSFAPGTRHSSHSERGCLLLVLLRQPNRPL